MSETVKMDHPIADAKLPRIDRFALVNGEVKCLTGTPTEGATLENLWGLAPLPEGAISLEPRVLVPAGSVPLSTTSALPPAWHTEVQPSNKLVMEVREWIDRALDPQVPVDRQHVYQWNAMEELAEFVSTMSHTDVLTAQRIAKEVLR